METSQLLMIGLNGKNFAQVKRAAYDGLIGGVVVFSSAFQTKGDLKNKLTELQMASPIPLLFAIDGEGGVANRFTPDKGFSPFPGALEMGEKGDNFTYETGRRIAHDLHDIGFRMNFAPVVDVAINPENPVIVRLHRSFSSDPEVVKKRADQFAKSHLDEGIVPTAKHFPGHGSSRSDSHLGWTDISQTWSEKELIPFKNLSARTAVMSGHLFNHHLDPEHPASLSKAVIDGLLRKKLGFNGVVVTDDLQMGAIRQHYSLERTIELAVNAGSDILLFAQQFRNDDVQFLHATLLNLLKEGRLSRSRISESAHRVLLLKKDVGLSPR